MASAPALLSEPPRDCPDCPRLVAFRARNRAAHGDWHNAPVPSFGAPDPRLLIVGLAPGLQGANRTGRPFTGDYAGDLLYDTLAQFGFATGSYGRSPDDGLILNDCLITNAVRCVPPENKPTTQEIRQCNAYLAALIAGLDRLTVILALGKIAHDAVLRAQGERLSAWPFAHGSLHRLGGLHLADSYHCSRYNTNTRRLTPDMFRAVFAQIAGILASA